MTEAFFLNSVCFQVTGFVDELQRWVMRNKRGRAGRWSIDNLRHVFIDEGLEFFLFGLDPFHAFSLEQQTVHCSPPLSHLTHRIKRYQHLISTGVRCYHDFCVYLWTESRVTLWYYPNLQQLRLSRLVWDIIYGYCIFALEDPMKFCVSRILYFVFLAFEKAMQERVVPQSFEYEEPVGDVLTYGIFMFFGITVLCPFNTLISVPEYFNLLVSSAHDNIMMISFPFTDWSRISIQTGISSSSYRH